MEAIEAFIEFARLSAEHWPHWAIGPVIAGLAIVIGRLHSSESQMEERYRPVRR
jgi:hypothetical protein